MGTDIRDATVNDLDDIAVCHNAAWRRAYRDLFPSDYLDGDELAARQRAVWELRFSAEGPRYPVRVAVTNDKMVGFATFDAGPSTSTVELTGLYVEPNSWSTGVGSALQRDARDTWRAQGYRTAFLWVAIDNPRAHRSYKKNGWISADETTEQNIDGHTIAIQKLTLVL